MRRRNREINIFNMSALDLFASALGAFILLFAILMPYYLKTSKIVMQENVQLKAQIKDCKIKVANLEKSVADLQVKNDGLQQQLNECEQQKQQLKAQNDQLKEQIQKIQEELNKAQQSEAENDQLKKQIQKMQRDLNQAQQSLDDRVKFALLGINTTAQSFILVVDMSGSMSAYTKTMRNTVARILEPFKKKHKVQIFGFREDDNGVHFENWKSPHNLAEMTNGNKQSANGFADALASKFGGGTPTGDALLEALKYDAEAIILLTDGAPSKSGRATSPLDIIKMVSAQNSGLKEIHTVAIGDYNAQPGLVDFLQKLAAENGGSFVGAAK